MIFYLGTHHPNWLATVHVPLFVSRSRLYKRKTFPRASAPWALDSGGFSEIKQHGRWTISEERYVALVRLLEREIGSLAWCAPMDWMCETIMLEKTGKTVAEHQRLTVENFVRLRHELGELVVPVIQGWTLDDYLRCAEMYERRGVALEDEPTIGLGSVCRRQDTQGAATIVNRLADDGLRIHGFGVKMTGLARFGHRLVSSDSLSWSFTARREGASRRAANREWGIDVPYPPSHPHKNCANCLPYALSWRRRLLNPKGAA